LLLLWCATHLVPVHSSALSIEELHELQLRVCVCLCAGGAVLLRGCVSLHAGGARSQMQYGELSQSKVEIWPLIGYSKGHLLDLLVTTLPSAYNAFHHLIAQGQRDGGGSGAAQQLAKMLKLSPASDRVISAEK